jgi:hypothetical protein
MVPGLYFCVLEGGGVKDVIKIVVLR